MINFQLIIGKITIKQCDKEIKSVELQLVRVETVGSNGDYTKESSEIQTIQIGVGDVARDFSIPIFMIFPRLFTCPTVETPNFRIEFEVFVHIIFIDDVYISESFPVSLHRF
uniref:Uncharacterized protein n=1 Tax=Romanomermis culicivorax TaxID=13658 RepID=A0A915K8M7_ROMCU